MIQTLEPPPTPTPTAPPTPPPPPMEAPTGAALQAASGSQAGAPSSFCWSASAGGHADCRDLPPPVQAEGLSVRRGETVTVEIQATAAPSDASIRPWQGSSEGVPSQRIEPALVGRLQLDLEPGDWSMDLCATWRGHGKRCWLFRLDVAQGP